MLKIGIEDMNIESSAEDRYLLIVVDRASKYLFAHPLLSKEALGVARTILELMLTFGVSLSTSTKWELTEQVVDHLC